MRLLLISWEYAPVIEGGLGRHVTQLARSLAAEGHEVHILTRGVADGPGDADGTEHEAGERGDVDVHRVRIGAVPLTMATFMPWVTELNTQLAAGGAALVHEHRFDVVHSHDWLVAAAAESVALAAGVPWLVTVHATEFGRHNGWVHAEPQRQIHLAERRMVRRADRVIACSQYMRGHVCRIFGVAPEQVEAIPNGIDPADLRPPAGMDIARLRARYADPAEPLVLMVGRLVHEKGFHVALDALASLGDAPRWLLAGAGPAGADLRAQAARLGLTGTGELLGRIDDDLLHGLYQAADIVVVPSLFEPFGIVPLEAMAAGCPVIVTDTGGLREVAATDAGAGLTVAPGDVGALTDVLARLLGDPDRRAAVAQAASAHLASFDWGVIAARTAAIYAELASAASPAAADRACTAPLLRRTRQIR